MTSSRNFSRSIKRAAYARSGGRCEHPSCGVSLPAGWGGIHFDHVIPFAISGDSSLGNIQCICFACHLQKTAARDIPAIAKVMRIADKRIGIKRSGKKLPGGRDSAIRITMNNGVQRRLGRGETHRVLMEKLHGGFE